MKEYIIQDLFKIPLYKTILTLNNKQISNYCLDIQKQDGDKIKTDKTRISTNIGGWHSNDLIGEHKPLNDLFLSIVKNGNIFAKELQLKDNLSIDNIWININSYKDSAKTHSHPRSILSGVYYAQIPKDSGDIAFNNTSGDLIYHCWNKDKINNYNSYNSPEWFLPVAENILYIFPSWLNHYVKPNMNKTEKRISISFNLI